MKAVKSVSSSKTTEATVRSRPQPHHPLRCISTTPLSWIVRRNWEVTLAATIFGEISSNISLTISSPWIASRRAFFSASDRNGTEGESRRKLSAYIVVVIVQTIHNKNTFNLVGTISRNLPQHLKSLFLRRFRYPLLRLRSRCSIHPRPLRNYNRIWNY